LPFQGKTHPSYTDNEELGITSLSSIPTISPYPSHFLHAPLGLLKLKKLTEGCVNLIPSSSKFVLKYLYLLESIFFTTHFPFPSNIAVDIESLTLSKNCFDPFTIILSITRKILL